MRFFSNLMDRILCNKNRLKESIKVTFIDLTPYPPLHKCGEGVHPEGFTLKGTRGRGRKKVSLRCMAN